MKYNLKIFFIAAITLILLLSCQQSSPAVPQPPSPLAEQNSVSINDAGEVAFQHVTYISEEIGARWPGSEEEAQTAEYIKESLSDYGYEVINQEFQFSDEEGRNNNSANIMVVKPGNSGQEIIVGAHYDSSVEGQGADDNASGVGVLLELAMRLNETETPYTIRLIAFGAEENDLDGSRYYVDQMDSTEINNIIGMINLDSVIAGDFLYIYADEAVNTDMRDWLINEDIPDFDFVAKTLEDLNEDDGTACECADYGPFSDAGIPFAYIEATNWNLGDLDGYTQVDPQYGDEGAIIHTQYDDVETIEQIFPDRISGHLNFLVIELYDLLTAFVSDH
jgi:alkaline phosphatase isozyme conversion protein